VKLSADSSRELNDAQEWNLVGAEVNGILDVKMFDTRRQLINYTRREKKFYPKTAAKEAGPIRCLLKSMR
jgi:hypothetical protein